MENEKTSKVQIGSATGSAGILPAGAAPLTDTLSRPVAEEGAAHAAPEEQAGMPALPAAALPAKRLLRFKEDVTSPTLEIGVGEYHRTFIDSEQPFAVTGLTRPETDSQGKKVEVVVMTPAEEEQLLRNSGFFVDAPPPPPLEA
jgi:hypothetical protein